MTENEDYQTNLPAISGDGFDDNDDDRGGSIIKGMKLKFSNDGDWVTGSGQAIAAEREFLAVEILRVVQKWLPGASSPETHILTPGEKPNIDALNEAAPREEWVEKFGKMVGPYEYALVLYLIDPETLAPFTYVTSTAGGGQAIGNLREATRLARRIRGSNVYPRVRLADEYMRTAYGGRQRPAFDVVGYEVLRGGDNTTLAPAAPKQIEHTEPEPKPEPKPEKRKVRI
jgi:hypothetical protein